MFMFLNLLILASFSPWDLFFDNVSYVSDIKTSWDLRCDEHGTNADGVYGCTDYAWDTESYSILLGPGQVTYMEAIINSTYLDKIGDIADLQFWMAGITGIGDAAGNIDDVQIQVLFNLERSTSKPVTTKTVNHTSLSCFSCNNDHTTHYVALKNTHPTKTVELEVAKLYLGSGWCAVGDALLEWFKSMWLIVGIAFAVIACGICCLVAIFGASCVFGCAYCCKDDKAASGGATLSNKVEMNRP